MKSRKHTSKNLHNFVQSLTDKPIGDKLLIIPDKVVHVWISSQKPRGVKSPGVALGLANARPPGLTMRANTVKQMKCATEERFAVGTATILVKF